MLKSEKLTLMFLDVIFLTVAVIASVFGNLPEVTPGLFWLMFGLSAFRIGRTVSFNLIFKWLRDALGVTEVKDSSGAGYSNEATGSGVMRMLGELVCCPICSSQWAAIGLLLADTVSHKFGLVLLYAFSAAGIAELLNWVSEYFEWGGRASREVSGSYWLEKNRSGLPEVNYNFVPTNDQGEVKNYK